MCAFHFRLYLGVTDREVETVFRTTDGFTTPWIKWGPNEPQGTAGLPEGREDCATMHPTDSGMWIDNWCSDEMEYYCEGNLTWEAIHVISLHFHVFSDLLYIPSGLLKRCLFRNRFKRCAISFSCQFHIYY